MKSAPGKIDSLQAVRGFAAAIVILFHGDGIIGSKFGYQFLDNFFCAGFSGVDIFFVLSGFVMYYTCFAKNYTAGFFLKKRFVRIYPVYWLVSLIPLIHYFLAPSKVESHQLNIQTIINSFLLIPQKQHLLPFAWTLVYEIIFYIVFAFSFLKKPVYLLWVFVCWIGLIVVLQIAGVSSGIYEIDTFINPIIINFALGCAVAHYYIKYPSFKYYPVFIITGFLLFLISWALYYYQVNSGAEINIISGKNEAVMFGIPSAIFMFGILYSKARINQMLIHFGDASYSLYLLHHVIIYGLANIILLMKLKNYFNGFAGGIFIFIVTFAIASCFYLIVEKPLIKKLNQKLLHKQQ